MKDYKFEVGDLIVLEGLQKPTQKIMYKIVGLGVSHNLPDDTKFPIYQVQVINSKNNHTNVLEKSTKWVDCAYRKATKAEKTLFGKNFETKDEIKPPGKDLLEN